MAFWRSFKSSLEGPYVDETRFFRIFRVNVEFSRAIRDILTDFVTTGIHNALDEFKLL